MKLHKRLLDADNIAKGGSDTPFIWRVVAKFGEKHMNEKLNKPNNQSAVFGVKTAIALILIAFMLLSSLVYGLGLLINPLNLGIPWSTNPDGTRQVTATGIPIGAPWNFRVTRIGITNNTHRNITLAWDSGGMSGHFGWYRITWVSSDQRSGDLTFGERIAVNTLFVSDLTRNNSYTFTIRGYNTFGRSASVNTLTIPVDQSLVITPDRADRTVQRGGTITLNSNIPVHWGIWSGENFTTLSSTLGTSTTLRIAATAPVGARISIIFSSVCGRYSGTFDPITVISSDGVYRIRNTNVTVRYMAMQSGHSYRTNRQTVPRPSTLRCGTRLVTDTLRQNSAWESIGQNFRIEFHPAYNAYTIAPISHANGFRRLITATEMNGNVTREPRANAPTPDFTNQVMLQNPSLNVPAIRDRQLFIIQPKNTGGGYSIRLRGNTMMALTRVGNNIEFRAFTGTNPDQRWHFERNIAYEEQENYYAGLDWHWPVDNTGMTGTRYSITSSFSRRTAGTHDGIDIGHGGRVNPQLLAVHNGRVRAFDYQAGGLGHWVEITIEQRTFLQRNAANGNYLRVRYAHMQNRTHFLNVNGVRQNLAVGNPVTRGQMVGRMGDTGNSFGEHLHLCVRTDGGNDMLAFGNRTNPMQFFAHYRHRLST